MDWRESLKNNITEANQLSEHLHLTKEQEGKLSQILERFPMTITEYYFSLINWDDEHDPIRKMCIPSIEETDLSGDFDTSGEATNTVIPGLQHKYKQTALMLSTHRCAMYCRHCFRKRLVGISDDETSKNFEDMADYIREHEEISNILISGGDPFLNSNQVIKHHLEVLSEIEHLDFIRFGTRTPVVLPSRISGDPELIDILQTYNRKKHIYIITQFNHPNELTKDAKQAIDALLRIGICVKNQTVLLRGINDTPQVLGSLLKKLTRWGIVPYYIFQCRPVTGVKAQFQVPLIEGNRIVEGARAMQNGQGKTFPYAMSHPSGKIQILGEDEDGNMLFKYQQTKDEKDNGRIFKRTLSPMQAWLDDTLN